MKLEEALQWADQWTEGQTFYEGMQGWRVVCAVLAAEVRRLQSPAVTPSTNTGWESLSSIGNSD